MKLLITGDRNWTDYDTIFWALAELPKDTVVIEGEARGADTIARECAEVLELEVIKVPADWERLGKAAGPVRNKKMLDMNPDLVYAFHNKIKKSKGTRDMCERSLKAGKTVILHTEHSPPKKLARVEI